MHVAFLKPIATDIGDLPKCDEIRSRLCAGALVSDPGVTYNGC